MIWRLFFKPNFQKNTLLCIAYYCLICIFVSNEIHIYGKYNTDPRLKF